MQDEFLFRLAAGVGIKFLRVVAGAERDERDRLRFATREQRGTVGARENADFAGDRTNHVECATVETFAMVKNQAANRFFLDVIKRVVDDERRDFFRAELGDEFFANFILDGVAGGFAGELAGIQQRGHKTVAGELLRFRENFVGNNLECDVAFLFADFRDEFFLRGDDGLDDFLRVFQRGVEISLGDFLRGTFIHDDVFFIADIDEVEIAVRLFGVRGVGNKLTVDATDAHRAERPGPRNIADHQRGARAEDAQNIGVVFAVRAQQHGLHLHFVIPALRKKRADRAVGETAGEDFLFRRTAFAFEVAAGEFSSRRRFFAVVNSQWKKVLAFLGFRRGHGGHENDGFAHLNRHGAVGLFGQLAGFDGDLLVADGGGDFM